MNFDTNWVPRSLITSSQSLEYPDVVSEQPSHTGCHNVQCCQYGMSTFGQAVDYYHDGIIAMALW